MTREKNKKVFTKSELNPKLFDEKGELFPEISDRLIRIAYDFAEKLEFDYELIDIVLTGSNASYQWVDDSDIDLHLVVNFGEGKDLKFSNANLTRKQWNMINEITVKGLPVEVYVESFDEPATSDGIYSIKNNVWIKRPVNPEELDVKENPQEIHEIYQNIAQKITELENEFKSGTKTDSEVFKLTKDLETELSTMRKGSLAKEGTFSSGNLAYKLLRMTGYMNKLYSMMRDAYAKSMTLEAIEENEVVTDTATIISAAPEALTKYLGVDKNKLFNLIKQSKRDGNVYNNNDVPIFTISDTGSDGIYSVKVKAVDESRYSRFKKKLIG